MTRRFNRVFAVVISIILLGCFVIVGCPSTPTTTTPPTTTIPPTTTTPPTTAPPIELKYSSMFYELDMPTQVEAHFFDLIEEKTAERVKVDRYPGGTLGGPPEHLPLVQSGAVDFANVCVDVHPSELPLHYILSHTVCSDWEKVKATSYALEFEIPETAAILEEEARQLGLKCLFWNEVGGYGLLVRFSADRVSDLSGKKLAVVNPGEGKIFSEFGMVSVIMWPPDYYESLSRGVVDAIYGGPALYDTKTYEVGKSWLNIGGAQVFCPLFMNLDTWESLPSDVQEAIISATEEISVYQSNFLRDLLNTSFEAYKQSGLTFVDTDMLPASELEKISELRWSTTVEEVMQIATDAGVGYKANILLDQWEKLLNE
jgi:TRAP-type C4-dicarboxylate transport system substrate-binding protein